MKTMEMNVAERAEIFARARHGETGALYDGLPYYEGHVLGVIRVLADFGFVSIVWQARASLHDIPEDTETTLHELRREFGDEVALISWAVCGFGPNRKIRNKDIYFKIGIYGEEAAILKVADRIFNVEHSKQGSRHWKMYLEELADFAAATRHLVPPAMWDRLIKAFGPIETMDSAMAELLQNQL